MDSALIAARTLHIGAAISLAGALGFHSIVARPAYAKHGDKLPSRLIQGSARIGWTSLALAVLSAIPWLALVTMSMSGATLNALFADRTIITVFADTQFGQVWVLRAGFAVLLVPALAALGTNARVDLFTTIVGIIFLAAIAWQGHAGAAAGWGGRLEAMADALHLLAAGVWLGALLPLALTLRELSGRVDGAALDLGYRVTAGFSMLGLACVAALLLSGAANAWFLVGTLPALIGTPYGLLLLAKLGLFALMVALAAINRGHWLPRFKPANTTCAPHAAMTQIARNALTEAAIGLVVIAVVGALGTLTPAVYLHG